MLEHHTGARRKTFSVRTIDFDCEEDMQDRIADLEKAHPGCNVFIVDIKDGSGTYYRERWQQFVETFTRDHAATSQNPPMEK
jgi:hypothetical protein